MSAIHAWNSGVAVFVRSDYTQAAKWRQSDIGMALTSAAMCEQSPYGMWPIVVKKDRIMTNVTNGNDNYH
jgi:hypothetical protein